MSLFCAPAGRHLGMDMVRAFAILTVLVGHALIFFPQFFSVLWLLFLAVFGVELFFALSGFLIGNILIRLSKGEFGFSSLWQFWVKRWMRTLPAYLVVAVVIMLVVQDVHLSYFVFLQNFYPEQLADFQVSWSLAIEEWFYLSFPLLMYLLSRQARAFKLNVKAWLVPVAVAVFVLVPLLLRYMELQGTGAWDFTIRKQIHLRLDGIAYGVFLAWLYEQRKTLFTTRALTWVLGMVLAVGFCGLWWLYNRQIDVFTATPSVFNNLVFYPLINLYCAAFVAFSIRFQSYSASKWQSAVLYVSLISYSLYLVHFHIYKYFAGSAEIALMAFAYLAASLLVMFSVGTALYLLVEKPFIDLRNRITAARVSTRL
jgi:peptidoglycan/LPS O-acetylase OafA/YrhL